VCWSWPGRFDFLAALSNSVLGDATRIAMVEAFTAQKMANTAIQGVSWPANCSPFTSTTLHSVMVGWRLAYGWAMGA